MHRQQKLPWWLRVAGVLVLVLVQALVQDEALQRVRVLVRAQVLRQVRVQEERWRHRSLWQQLPGSSWHHASTNLHRWSRRRQWYCASCQRFERQQQTRELRLRTLLPLCSNFSWIPRVRKSASALRLKDVLNDHHSKRWFIVPQTK